MRRGTETGKGGASEDAPFAVGDWVAIFPVAAHQHIGTCFVARVMKASNNAYFVGPPTLVIGGDGGWDTVSGWALFLFPDSRYWRAVVKLDGPPEHLGEEVGDGSVEEG
jgi:hypothetical protein